MPKSVHFTLNSRTSNPDKETYDLYKAFAEAFRENEREEQEFPEELKKAVNKAYGNSLYAGRHSVDFGCAEQEMG